MANYNIPPSKMGGGLVQEPSRRKSIVAESVR